MLQTILDKTKSWWMVESESNGKNAAQCGNVPKPSSKLGRNLLVWLL